MTQHEIPIGTKLLFAPFIIKNSGKQQEHKMAKHPENHVWKSQSKILIKHSEVLVMLFKLSMRCLLSDNLHLFFKWTWYDLWNSLSILHATAHFLWNFLRCVDCAVLSAPTSICKDPLQMCSCHFSFDAYFHLVLGWEDHKELHRAEKTEMGSSSVLLLTCCPPSKHT